MNCCRVTCDGLASHPGEVMILPVVSYYRNQYKLWWFETSYMMYKNVRIFFVFWLKWKETVKVAIYHKKVGVTVHPTVIFSH